MKTISPVSEQEKLPNGYEESTNNRVSFGEIAHEQVFNESDNLIVCNSELASSFQDVKIEKSRLNPGHYIHKVFLHKLKSQSAPSLDKRKQGYTEASTANDEHSETSSPLMNVQENVPSEEENAKENNDSWFKTWPECGVDKCVFRNGKVLDDISKDGDTPEDDVISNKTLVDETSIDDCKQNGIAVDQETEKFKQCNTCVQNCSCNSLKANSPIPLENLLYNLPLAYSPITKQIHLIRSSENVPNLTVNVNCDVGNSLNVTDCKHPVERTLCRVGTEVSSFSSNVSSLSDNSPSTNEDSLSGSLLDHGDNCSLVSIGNCSIVSEDSIGPKPKRKGISGFFSRGVFGWKGRGAESQCAGERWSIFGRSNINNANTSSLQVEYSEDGHSIGGDSGRGIQGSTGLIQLERPAWLPAKSSQERQAHADQHDKIIHSARKREMKDAKQRKKVLQNQLKVEDELAHATKFWSQEILPKWHQMKSQRRTLEMWWQGAPPCVRGKLWRLAISNDLNITHDLYEICAARAQERLNSAVGSNDSMCDSFMDADREASMELIQLDISRTFPHLCIFQKGGPYYDMLHCLLAAYVCYRPDVGYVQGMSFIAAILILNMDAPDAFICFANVLNRPCHRAFYSLDQQLMEAYYSTYNEILKDNLPILFAHLESSKLTPDLYLLDWVYTVFSKAMSLDVASRVWDVFLRDGEEFLFRTAIGVLHLYQESLLSMDFLGGSKFLTKLPEDLTPAQLFKSISSVHTVISKRSFSQILSSHIHASDI